MLDRALLDLRETVWNAGSEPRPSEGGRKEASFFWEVYRKRGVWDSSPWAKIYHNLPTCRNTRSILGDKIDHTVRFGKTFFCDFPSLAIGKRAEWLVHHSNSSKKVYKTFCTRYFVS